MDEPLPDPPPPEPREPKWWQFGWGKWPLLIVILVAGFYVHQNLLGAMAWKRTQQKILAAGENLDPATFIVESIPDEQNLGALPIFQLERGPGGKLDTYRLLAALDLVKNVPNSKDSKSGSSDELPYLGHWFKGDKTDLAAVRQRFLALGHEPATSTATSPQLFAQLCPALAELRAANMTHPLCLLPQDDNPVIWNRTFVGSMNQIKMAKVLAYEERLALACAQPDLALQDLQLGWKLNSGLHKHPTVISGLVSLAVVAIQMESVRQDWPNTFGMMPNWPPSIATSGK